MGGGKTIRKWQRKQNIHDKPPRRSDAKMIMKENTNNAFFVGVAIYATALTILFYCIPLHKDYIIGSIPMTALYCILRAIKNK